jgi:glycosyltransferase involved in cell wall biosynthesis
LWIWWENIIYKWFLKQIVLIRVYSETTKHKIIRLYGISPEKILVIKDIPYNHFYPNEVGGLKSRHFLNLPPDAFVYLFFGSVKPYKGIETLITTFNHLPSENDYLIIAGICREKKYFQHILELSGKNTRIVIHNEFIKMDHVQYYMNAADVVVLPFINVEHSGSVDLAVSFAKPVVTIGTSLLREQLRNQSELLFDDPDQLLRILKEVKSMDLKKIGEDNFRAVELSNFSEIVALFH